MAEAVIIETIYGRQSKYDVVKKYDWMGDPKFYVRRDGRPDGGSFSSLSVAVAAAMRRAR